MLIRSQPDGEARHLSAVVRLRARRSGTSRFVAEVQRPLLAEAEAPRAPGNPHRAVRWVPDGGYWERTWAVGETATLRVDGRPGEIGVRVRPSGGGKGWEVENRGPHTLRRLVAVDADGRMRALPDLPPDARRLVDAGAPTGADRLPEGPSLAFWSALLPAREARADRAPVLLAALEPPMRVLRFLEGEIWTRSESHLMLILATAGAR